MLSLVFNMNTETQCPICWEDHSATSNFCSMCGYSFIDISLIEVVGVFQDTIGNIPRPMVCIDCCGPEPRHAGECIGCGC